MSLQGSLREMGVLELLELMGSQRRTGTLDLSLGVERVHLHFRDGLLVASHRVGAARNEAFLDALVGLGHISPAEALALADRIERHKSDVWLAALEIPHLTRETCKEVYRQATEAAIDRVLLWDSGHFAILPLAPVAGAIDEGLSSEALLIDAMRRLDELAAWKQGQLPPESVPVLAGDAEQIVSSDPLRRAVLRQIDGRRSLAEVVDAARLGAHQVYEAVIQGLDNGTIELLQSAAPSAPAPVKIILRRSPAFAALTLLLTLALATSILGRRLSNGPDRWADARLGWEEIDLRKSIEVYRHRTGTYPHALIDLESRGLPLPGGDPNRFSYAIDGSGYRLVPLGSFPASRAARM